MSAAQPPGTPDHEPPPRSDTMPAETARAGTEPTGLGEDEPSTWQPWLYVKIGLLLFAVAWSIAFVVENRQEINVHFVFATANVHVIWMILLLLAVGLVGGVLISQLYRHRRRTQLAKQGRKPSDSRRDVRGRDEAEGQPR